MLHHAQLGYVGQTPPRHPELLTSPSPTLIAFHQPTLQHHHSPEVKFLLTSGTADFAVRYYCTHYYDTC